MEANTKLSKEHIQNIFTEMTDAVLMSEEINVMKFDIQEESEIYATEQADPKRIILPKTTSEAVRSTCEALYGDPGQGSVRDLCQKIGLNEDPCEQCETGTPTISDMDTDTCAMCGGSKKLSE